MAKLGWLLVVGVLAASCGHRDDMGLKPTAVTPAAAGTAPVQVRYFVADTKDLKTAYLPLVAISDDGQMLQPAFIENFPCKDFRWAFEVSHPVKRERSLVLAGTDAGACLTTQKIHWSPKKPGRLFSESTFAFDSQNGQQSLTYTQVEESHFLDLIYENLPKENGRGSYSPFSDLGAELCERFFIDCAAIDHDRL